MSRTQKTLALFHADKEIKKLAQNHFVYLLAALLALICMMPVIDVLSSGRIAFTLVLVFLSATIVVASWTFRASQRSIRTGICFSAIALLLSIIAAVTDSATLGYLSLVAHIVFWSTGVWIAGSQVLAAGRITLNRITGAVCVYMMVAVIFAFLNTPANWLFPGSFTNLTATGLTEELPEFIYYSFVTLNTLGYGDISPVGSLARVLAILEVTFGVFYMAILVASLVSMHISNQPTTGQNATHADPASSNEGGPDEPD